MGATPQNVQVALFGTVPQKLYAFGFDLSKSKLQNTFDGFSKEANKLYV